MLYGLAITVGGNVGGARLEGIPVRISPLEAAEGASPRTTIVVAMNEARSVELPPGRYLVEAVLPGGERLAKSAEVRAGAPPSEVPLEARHSSSEWLGWSSVVAGRGGQQITAYHAARPPRDAALGLESFSSRPEGGAPPEMVSSQEQWPVLRLLVVRNGKWSASGPLSLVDSALRGVTLQDQTVPISIEARASGALRSFLLTPLPGAESWAYEAVNRHGPGTRYFLELRRRGAADCDLVSLPIPWILPGDTLAIVQLLLPSEGEPPRVIVQDPARAAVLSFLERGDVAAARAAKDIVPGAGSMLEGKLDNPLAAAAGACILLRLRELDTLVDSWLENLAEWYPWLPDGDILIATKQLRTSLVATGGRATRDATKLAATYRHLLRAADAGPPLFSACVRMLVEGLRKLASRAPDDQAIAKALAKATKLAAHVDMDSVFVWFRGLDAERPEIDPFIERRPMTLKERLSKETKEAFSGIVKAMRDQASAVRATPGLVRARPGYRGGTKPEPALVLAFLPPLPENARVLAAELGEKLRVPVDAVEADVEEQLRYSMGEPVDAPSDLERLLGLDGEPDVMFGPPIQGTYAPPANAPPLDPIEEEMAVTLCASPDAGWPVLREFFQKPIDKRLTVGIYQFTAEHVYRAIRTVMRQDDDAKLQIAIHPYAEAIQARGTKANDIYGPEILDRLEKAFGDRFDYARTAVGEGKTFGRAYHIKVAVADGKRFWLSSGNWQSSNLPKFDPIGAPDELPAGYARKYNREYHVVIEHAGLAKTFERYLNHDFRLAAGGEEPSFGLAPDLAVAETPEEVAFAQPPTYFEPLSIRRKVRVQPVLTPDNYAEVVQGLIESATERVYFQNQYINLNPSGGFPAFEKLIDALLQKMSDGLDVRVLCRDLMKEDKLDMLLALGFDRSKIRFMTNTHTKTIIVDGKRILVGSHNWSNEGTVSNRDASLLFDDPEIAGYYEKIFLYDWERRGGASPAKSKPRVVTDGSEERFSAGGRVRVGFAEVFGEDGDWELAARVAKKLGRTSSRVAPPPVPPATDLVPPPRAPAPVGVVSAPAGSSALSTNTLSTTITVEVPLRIEILAEGIRAVPRAALAPQRPEPEAAPPTEPARRAAPPSGVLSADALSLSLNGVDGTTGHYLVPPLSISQAAALARQSLQAPPSWEVRSSALRAKSESFGIPTGLDPEQLAQVGWGVIVPRGWSQRDEVLRALGPLISARKQEVGDRRFKILEYDGKSVKDFLADNGGQYGTISPLNVPYYLLILGGPELIPWEFQYVLDIEYATGRLSFDDVAAYGRYAATVVAIETKQRQRRAKRIAYFGTAHPGDRATKLSSAELVRPLFDGGSDGAVAAQFGFGQELCLGADATKARLGQLFGGAGRSAVVFTASHGIGFPSGHEAQRRFQGALLTQDWNGVGTMTPSHYFAGSDVAVTDDVAGLIAFLFACYGGGTPRLDSFPQALDTAPVDVAPAPFVGALPQALLGHPRGSALAVVGHVDRAWGFSIQQPGGNRQIGPFREGLAKILSGVRIGSATRDFSDRYSSLSAELLNRVRPGQPAVDDLELVREWIERNDAQAYVLLGDPAVRAAV